VAETLGVTDGVTIEGEAEVEGVTDGVSLGEVEGEGVVWARAMARRAARSTTTSWIIETRAIVEKGKGW
jgi:hypothetical protein